MTQNLDIINRLKFSYLTWNLAFQKDEERIQPREPKSSLKFDICRILPRWEQLNSSSWNVGSPSLNVLWITINVFTATCEILSRFIRVLEYKIINMCWYQFWKPQAFKIKVGWGIFPYSFPEEKINKMICLKCCCYIATTKLQ